MKLLPFLITVLSALHGEAGLCAEPLTGKAFQLADQAYKAVAAGDLDKAAAAVQAALRVRPDHPQLLALLAQVQTLRHEDDAAARTLDQALAIEPGNARLLAQRGFLRLGHEDHGGASADFRSALETGQLAAEEIRNVALALADILANDGHYDEAAQVLSPLAAGDLQITAKWQADLIHGGAVPAEDTLIDSPEVTYALVSMAYKALQAADDGRALELFLMAERHGGLSATQYGDAGYAARRSFRNQDANRLFIAAIDATQSKPPEQQSFGPRELFGLRRAVDDLNRYWGLVVSTSVSPGGQTGPQTIELPGFARGGVTQGDVTQVGVEAYVQPPGIGYRDGRQLQFFIRSFQTIDDESGGAHGGKTNQGSLGVRWKPMRDYNFVLTAERLIGIGALANDDWLLRAGFSLDNGVDIQPPLDHWPYRTLFAEATYFIDQARSVDSLEARWGHSFRLPLPVILTFTPHLVFGADWDTAAVEEVAAGAGIGGSVRWWFRETPYRAPASYVDFTLQYRVGLVDKANRQDGAFVRLTLWY